MFLLLNRDVAHPHALLTLVEALVNGALKQRSPAVQEVRVVRVERARGKAQSKRSISVVWIDKLSIRRRVDERLVHYKLHSALRSGLASTIHRVREMVHVDARRH